MEHKFFHAVVRAFSVQAIRTQCARRSGQAFGGPGAEDVPGSATLAAVHARPARRSGSGGSMLGGTMPMCESLEQRKAADFFQKDGHWPQPSALPSRRAAGGPWAWPVESAADEIRPVGIADLARQWKGSGERYRDESRLRKNGDQSNKIFEKAAAPARFRKTTTYKLEQILIGWREQREAQVIVTRGRLYHSHRVRSGTGVPLKKNRHGAKRSAKLLKMYEGIETASPSAK